MVRTTQSVRLVAWLLILLNLLMAYGCIWIFMRLAPVSGESNARNLRSLASCEEMLTAVAQNDAEAFSAALKSAGNNITEPEETPVLEQLILKEKAAFSGDQTARKEVIGAICSLSQINRAAMENSAKQVSSFGMAGAWSVVFMAIAMLLAELIFKNKLMKGIILPLQEIGEVVRANSKGDHMRRCSGTGFSSDIQHICSDLNDVLDQAMPNPFEEKK